MLQRSLPALAFAAALSPAAAPAQAQQLSYRVPSPATATYVMVDSTGAFLSTPGAPTSVAGTSSFTYELSFVGEGEGMRVSAALAAYDGQISGPLMPARAVSRSEAGVGDVELLLARDGMSQVVSGQRSDFSTLPLLVEPYEAMFPRLPAGDVRTGDVWTDTVTLFAPRSLERVVGYTYTLAGDTIVEGRRQLRIDISGDTRMTFTEDAEPAAFAGSETGHFLWDVDRGLPAYWEVSRRYEGTVELPDGSFEMSFSGVTRLRLVD